MKKYATELVEDLFSTKGRMKLLEKNSREWKKLLKEYREIWRMLEECAFFPKSKWKQSLEYGPDDMLKDEKELRKEMELLEEGTPEWKILNIKYIRVEDQLREFGYYSPRSIHLN